MVERTKTETQQQETLETKAATQSSQDCMAAMTATHVSSELPTQTKVKWRLKMAQHLLIAAIYVWIAFSKE